MKMKKVSKTRWMIICAVPIVLIIIFMSSGCSILEEQMLKAKSLVGFAGDKDIIVCTSNTESGCEGWVSETTGSTTD